MLSILLERAKWKKHKHSMISKLLKFNSIKLKTISIKGLKEFAIKKASEKKLCNQIEAAKNKSLALHALQHWAHQSVNSINKRNCNKLSTKLARQKYLKTYFRLWHTLFLNKSMLEEHLQRAQIFHRQKLARKFLSGWKSWFDHHSWKTR